MLSEVINMKKEEIILRITPNMIRNIIKGTKGSGEHRFATIDEAIMFIKLFGEQIEDALRNTLMNEVRKHYE
jgi:hypothetical protein